MGYRARVTNAVLQVAQTVAPPVTYRARITHSVIQLGQSIAPEPKTYRARITQSYLSLNDPGGAVAEPGIRITHIAVLIPDPVVVEPGDMRSTTYRRRPRSLVNLPPRPL